MCIRDRTCDALIFMVDASKSELLPESKKELSLLLENSELEGISLLVLANKVDLTPQMAPIEIIQGLNLDYVVLNPWVVVPISALCGTNLTQVIEWLLKRTERKK
eukprot:TRINITY_DN0_c2263_g1_i1.p1 TRINITY_DN0_c2263_g1~~TRINITY_DN0_c2263_g1_i1.p1  ORF type:complete len:105 (-),score=25.90 TRINITY_DN0_c2263_g1_i1:56-370(-)